MPNRILRDWTDSLAFDGLPAEAERLFVRILMKVDDFGRFHAHPQLLKSACFPLAEDLRANTVAAWLTQLSDRQLVFSYKSGTGQYLAVRKFRQRARAESSKFPPPDGQPADWMPPDDGHLTVTCQSSDGHPRAYSETESKTSSESNTEASGARAGAVIPTWDEVKAIAVMRGIPEPSAKSFFDHHEGNGLWLNQFSKLINWQHKLSAWAASDRQRPRPATTKPTGAMCQPHELKMRKLL